jgi:tRNA threonylcarbamoyladenosine biosynthesis protein TsaE
MQGPFPITLDLSSETATAAFAERLAPACARATRCCFRGRSGRERPTSHAHSSRHGSGPQAGTRTSRRPPSRWCRPTTTGTAEIWHADLYRLTSAGEAAELGLDDAFRDAIVIVEWPDRLGADAPPGALRLAFADGATESARRLTLTPPTRAGPTGWPRRFRGRPCLTATP